LRLGRRQNGGVVLERRLTLGNIGLGLLGPFGRAVTLLRQLRKAIELLCREGQRAAVAFDVGLVRGNDLALLGQLRVGDGFRRLRALQICGGDIDGGLEVARVELDEKLAGLEGAVVGHMQGQNISGDLWHDRDGVGLQRRVVGLDPVEPRHVDISRRHNQHAGNGQRPYGDF
jgi:hypothetical protein